MFNLNSNDQEIINDLKAGGNSRRKAEDKLFNLFSYYVREGIKKHSLTQDESFDAYSDTILRAIQTITGGDFRGEASLKTYLHRIFYNKCADHFRKKSSNRYSVHQTISIPDMLYQLPDVAKPILEELMLKYDWERLKLMLNQMSENCRKLLLLTKDGYTTEEIRETLGFKSVDVVKTARLRCVEKLRQMYKGVNK